MKNRTAKCEYIIGNNFDLRETSFFQADVKHIYLNRIHKSS